ncbi:flavodoxin family protein [Kribbella sp. NPDC020789]
MSPSGRALIVYESMFGNTERVARAIRDGLRDTLPADLIPAYQAPTVVPGDVRFLIAGGPTHAFSMSRQSTRESARQQGDVVMPIEFGLRDWLDALVVDSRMTTGDRALPLEVATFDTRISTTRRLPGSAARAAAKILRRHRYQVVDSASFFVTESVGPISPAEIERALDWGRRLGRQLTDATPSGRRR